MESLNMNTLDNILTKAAISKERSAAQQQKIERESEIAHARLSFLQESLYALEQEIKEATINGLFKISFSPPFPDNSLHRISMLFELQTLIHRAGYEYEMYPEAHKFKISW